VPRIQLDKYGRRAFAVVGPTVWNALGNDLAIQISASPVSVAYLRRICFTVSAVLGAPSALEALCDNAMLYKLTLTVVDKQKDKTIYK